MKSTLITLTLAAILSVAAPIYAKPAPKTGPHLTAQASALFLAAYQGNTAKVKALLAGGLSPNQYGPHTETPLMLASTMNHPDVVKLLLAHGAHVDDKLDTHGFKGGSTALTFASMGMLNILAGAAAPPDPAESAANPAIFARKHPDAIRRYSARLKQWESGYDATVRMLVTAGANVNVMSNGKDTPIENAAGSMDPALVIYLLARGARLDIPVRDRDQDSSTGFKALVGATSPASKNATIVKLLLRHKASPNAERPGGPTPLGNAVNNDDLVIAKLLIDAHADVNYPSLGTRPLARAKSPRMIALLRSHGAVR